MERLGRIDLGELRQSLEGMGVDGWLLFDFHGTNPIAQRVVDPGSGLGFTRRLFVWLPKTGDPTILVHTLDAHLAPSIDGVVRYNTWQDLHRALEGVIAGRRVAMETSPDDAVPYLDRVPAGVVQLVTRLGADVVPSDQLVSQFAAQWSEAERAQHRKVAEALADIARTTLNEVVRVESSITEFELQRQVLAAIERAGFTTDSPPIVAFGVSGSNAHHEPSEHRAVTLESDMVILLDLWARTKDVRAWADQTWMGFSGTAIPARVTEVWEAVRDARDAVLSRLNAAHKTGDPVTGADLDDAARGLLEARGFGEHFGHRTGHSIDMELHGSGPHLDNFETHDTRQLIPGVAFSVEPGVYLPGEFGVRSEVNVMLSVAGSEVTPAEIQKDLVRAT